MQALWFFFFCQGPISRRARVFAGTRSLVAARMPEREVGRAREQGVSLTGDNLELIATMTAPRPASGHLAPGR